MLSVCPQVGLKVSGCVTASVAGSVPASVRKSTTATCEPETDDFDTETTWALRTTPDLYRHSGHRGLLLIDLPNMLHFFSIISASRLDSVDAWIV